jgi:hypothetical protein
LTGGGVVVPVTFVNAGSGVTNPLPTGSRLSQLGIFRPTGAPLTNTFMQLIADVDGSNSFNSPPDKFRNFGLNGANATGTAQDIAVAGDWDNTGVVRLGVFRCPQVGQPGVCNWYIDMNNNGVFDGTFGGDAIWSNFGLPGDIPVVGDWNGTGVSKIGVFRCPTVGECQWFLDLGNKHTFDPATVGIYNFGLPGDKPVVGNWVPNALSTADQVGIFRCPAAGTCTWIVDSLGKTGQAGQNVSIYSGADATFSFGLPGDIPVVGNWNGNGKKRIGVFRPTTGQWFVDTNGNGVFDTPADQTWNFGLPAASNPGGVADQPIVGFWTIL